MDVLRLMPTRPLLTAPALGSEQLDSLVQQLLQTASRTTRQPAAPCTGAAGCAQGIHQQAWQVEHISGQLRAEMLRGLMHQWALPGADAAPAAGTIAATSSSSAARENSRPVVINLALPNLDTAAVLPDRKGKSGSSRSSSKEAGGSVKRMWSSRTQDGSESGHDRSKIGRKSKETTTP